MTTIATSEETISKWFTLTFVLIGLGIGFAFANDSVGFNDSNLFTTGNFVYTTIIMTAMSATVSFFSTLENLFYRMRPPAVLARFTSTMVSALACYFVANTAGMPDLTRMAVSVACLLAAFATDMAALYFE